MMERASKSDDLFCHDLPTVPNPGIGKILVTGATGYIGGRLLPELLARGYNVRVMTRLMSPDLLQRWPGVEIVEADALRPESLDAALEGIHTAYYLIHSLLLGKKKFEAADIDAAINFRRAAERCGVKRIIYLGGLGDMRSLLSRHLMSRLQVAQELKAGTYSTTIIRAAIIIGSGSASFEILKNLVKRFPIIFIPRWGRTRCQPISIRDVIKYLVGVLEEVKSSGKSYDIGCDSVFTYEQMFRVFAEVLGKKRLFIRMPLSMIGFYSYVVSLFTPVPPQITRCLMEGCNNEVVCKDCSIKNLLPFRPLSYKEALVRALTREEQDRVHTRWSDAYPPAHELAIKLHELNPPPRFISEYSISTKKNAGKLFDGLCRIGGREGWYNSNILWRVRGAMDRILMGVGTSRGRRSTSNLRVNDVIDFWRVEKLEKNRILLLRAEMKLPGLAWLKFRIKQGKEKNCLSVVAFFQPRGKWGIFYWYLFLPFHHFIFYDIINQVEKRSS
jgi:uncharacterized protein YbjT (DUF2867 family)